MNTNPRDSQMADYRHALEDTLLHLRHFNVFNAVSVEQARLFVTVSKALGLDTPEQMKTWFINALVNHSSLDLVKIYAEAVWDGESYVTDGNNHFYPGAWVVSGITNIVYYVLDVDTKQNLLQYVTQGGVTTWGEACYYTPGAIPEWVRNSMEGTPLSEMPAPPFTLRNATDSGDYGRLIDGGFNSLAIAVEAARRENYNVDIENGYGVTIMNVVPLGKVE